MEASKQHWKFCDGVTTGRAWEAMNGGDLAATLNMLISV
jgi:hypothetical protein